MLERDSHTTGEIAPRQGRPIPEVRLGRTRLLVQEVRDAEEEEGLHRPVEEVELVVELACNDIRPCSITTREREEEKEKEKEEDMCY